MNTTTLNYSTPRVFFSGVYRVRSWDSVIGAAIFATLSASFGVGTLSANDIPLYGRGLLAAGTTLGLVGLTVILWQWSFNRERELRVTEDGIEYGGKHWPWHRITSLQGTRFMNSVTLEVYIGGRNLSLARLLPVTPNPTEAEYVALARVLSQFLAGVHPKVRVDPQPHVDSS